MLMRESSNMRYAFCILIYSTVSKALPSSPRNGGTPLVSHSHRVIILKNFGVIVVDL